MSNVPILDATSATRKIDVFQRTEGPDTVETQAIAVVNPTTGAPLLPTAGGAMPVEVQSPIALDSATLAALETVNVGNLPATQPISAASLPLPSGAATQATLANIDTDVGQLADAAATTDTGSFSVISLFKRALQNWTTLLTRVPALVSTIPLDSGAGMPVRPVPADLWRVSFASVGAGLQTAEMTLLQTGTGMAVSQSAGNLVVTSGTTANAETLIQSVRTFRGTHVLRYGLQLSQRIANNNFSIELADLVGSALAYTINSATSVTVTIPGNPFTAANVGQSVNLSAITGAAGIPGRFAIASVSGNNVNFTVAAWPASGSGTLTLWGWNYHRVLYNGTTATSANYDAQRRGWATGDTVATINTTAAPGHVGHLQSAGTAAAYADALAASNAAYQFTPRASRVANLPDDSQDLFLFIRVLNGTVAPASTTTLTLNFVSVEMSGRQKVYLAGADQAGAPFATAVQVVGGNLGTQAVSGAVTATVGTSINGGTISPLTVAGVSAEASSAKVATGNSAAAQTNASGSNAHFIVNVSAFAGTIPTLVVRVQIQDIVSAAWVDLPGAATGTITGTGATLLSVTNLPRVYRLAWVIGGTTPSFTFSVGMHPVI